MPEMTMINVIGQQDLLFILPEIILAVGVLFVLVLTALTFKKTSEENNAIMQTAMLFVLLSLSALVIVFRQFPPHAPQNFMMGALTADYFSYLMRILVLVGSGLTVAISHRFLEQNTRIQGDFYALVLGATLGGMFLASANDLITVFVALETLSITSYILAGYLRKTARSAEASLKYLIYGGMGTAVFLFGLSLIYGLSGSTNFVQIAEVLTQYQGVEHPTFVVLLLMVFAALAYKLSIAPFHMWAPDVYEGAPTPVSAFLSVVSKTAAFAITIRLLLVVFADFANWEAFWTILAVLSMTIGNFVALRQKDAKRLLAYSTVAHAGYMLLGLVVGSTLGIGSLVYYLIAYLFMNIGAFASVIYFSTLTRTTDIEAFSGLVQKRPGLALGFSICLLSLTGIPFTSGFFAKFFLFQTVAMSGTGYLWLVIVALLNSTISLAYYINIIRLMVVKEPSSVVQAIPSRADHPAYLSTALAFSVAVTLVLGIFASPFFNLSQMSVEQLAQERTLNLSFIPNLSR